jgi:exonuclease III
MTYRAAVMSDKALNILTWNVRGISSKSSGKVKRSRLRNNLRTLTPKPGIVLIQEYKVPKADCSKLGALGIRKGKGFWNGGCYNAVEDRWKAGTTILISSATSHFVIDSDIVVPGRAQWITCLLDKQVVGILNIYAPNKGPERATFWTQIANNLPQADSWVVGGDFNMVESETDRSSNTPKKLSREEREAWDRLVMRLGIEDVWTSDDFTHNNSLLFSWSNRQKGVAHRKARLDKFYVGEWGKERGGQSEILEGRSTLSDHLPVSLKLRRRCSLSDEDRLFKFNTTILEDPKLLAQMQGHWNEAPRPAPGGTGWQEWTVAALERVKVFCQETGRTRAAEKVNRERQLRATVASAERLLEKQPGNEFLFEKLNEAAQELIEREQTDLEWATIRSSTKWAQIEGRMSGDFFTSVNASSSSTPIQLLRKSDGTEHTTTEAMAQYANSFYQELFTTQGASTEGSKACEHIWEEVPQKVTNAMNVSLTTAIMLTELHTTMKLLPNGKTPGSDGFQSDFFLALWETAGTDLLEVCQEALSSGCLHRDLNSGILCLIPKGGDKTNLRNWRPITLLGSIYKCIAKLLANRLQPLLTQLIRPNQTGFMKGRSIIDNVFLAIESMDWAIETN